jgi:ribosomal protein L7/L12
VTVVACPSVGLPLAVALRGITRASVHELLGRLRSLPCRVAAGVPREQAEGLVARLAELGAEVQLVAAAAS